MKAMILAAGKGTRMASEQPKPLHEVDGLCLIEHRIIALVACGIKDIVINLHHKFPLIQQRLGNGQQFGANIEYSIEETLQLTGGGIVNALPLLGDEPFVVVNADVWADYDFSSMRLAPGVRAHLVLVDNPVHNHQGDFCLRADGKVAHICRHRLTFSGMSMMSAEFFADCPQEPFSLGPWLKRQIIEGFVSGEHHQGLWIDVGTQDRLRLVNDIVLQSKQLQRAVGHDARG